MKISVIMAVYKEPIVQIEQAINSIINQTYSNFDFIIINDCPERIDTKALLEKFSNIDRRIKVINNERNKGLVYNLNLGIKMSKNDIIARMDADDISHIDRFETQLNYLVKNNYDLIGSGYNCILNDVIVGTEESIKHPKIINEYLKYKDCVAHPTWMMKKKVFDDLGGYRNILACEDYDFLVRALLKGYRISNCPEVLLDYRLSSTGLSRKNAATQYVYGEKIRRLYSQKKDFTDHELDLFIKSNKTTRKIERVEPYVVAKIRRHDENSNLKKLFYLIRIVAHPILFFTDLNKNAKTKNLKKIDNRCSI